MFDQDVISDLPRMKISTIAAILKLQAQKSVDEKALDECTRQLLPYIEHLEAVVLAAQANIAALHFRTRWIVLAVGVTGVICGGVVFRWRYSWVLRLLASEKTARELGLKAVMLEARIKELLHCPRSQELEQELEDRDAFVTSLEQRVAEREMACQQITDDAAVKRVAELLVSELSECEDPRQRHRMQLQLLSRLHPDKCPAHRVATKLTQELQRVSSWIHSRS